MPKSARNEDSAGPETIGTLIRQACKERELSVGQLALRAGISPSTIYHWHRGDHQPQLYQLQAVLLALEASEDLRAWAEVLLDVPRSIRVVRAQALEGNALNGSMPGTGDLLRALRIRRGWTARRLADTLRVSPERISRWEASHSPPPHNRLEEILLLLEALPDERDALVACRVVLPLSESLTSLDACEQYLDTIRQDSFGSSPSAGDLKFLSLEAHLWPRARRDAGALRLLILCWLTHAEWLLSRGRVTEVKPLAERAIEAAQDQLLPEWFWVWATALQARFLVHHPKRQDYKQALALLSTMRDFPALTHQDHALYRDLAEIAGYAGQPQHALSLLTQSRAYAIRRGDEGSLKLSDIIEARILIRSGDPQAAQELLAHHSLHDPTQKVWTLLLMVEASLKLDRAEANFWLAEFDRHIERHNLSHFQNRADHLRDTRQVVKLTGDTT